MKISVLVPTRGRPDSMSRLWASIVGTVSSPGTVDLVFYVDSDDTASLDRVTEIGSPLVRAIVGPRISLSEAWNVLARESVGEVCMQCGDDVLFRTPNWDRLVVNAFEACRDKILFVYGRDGIQNEKMGTLGFLHRNWIQTVGYFLPPYFYSDCTDLWLTDVAKRAGRAKYIGEMFIEHLHPAAGKAALDQTHQERLVKLKAENALKIYSALKFKRKDDTKKLKEFIKDYAKR